VHDEVKLPSARAVELTKEYRLMIAKREITVDHRDR
jgi:hypothetical protein